MAQTTTEQQTLPLPDIEGYVHGIVGLDPVMIQCDGCGFVHTGTPGKGNIAILTCGIRFNPKARNDNRRLCRDCRHAEPDHTWHED